MVQLPSAILFACSMNAVRSPIAEAIMKHRHGRRLYVQSVGVRAGEPDPFVQVVVDEIGLDLSRHRPKTFEQLEDDYFDLIVTLSPEAHHHALEMTRTMACDVEFWPTEDVTLVEGNRETRLDAYRRLRDTLMQRIDERFGRAPIPEL